MSLLSGAWLFSLSFFPRHGCAGCVFLGVDRSQAHSKFEGDLPIYGAVADLRQEC